MKKIFTLLMLSFVLQNFAQEVAPENQNDTITPNTIQHKKGRQLRFNIVSRVYCVVPKQFGDHVLADAHRSGIGIGTSLSLLEYKNIRLTGGLEVVQYNVNDVAKAGNFKNTTNTSFHGAISYDFKLSDDFIIAPNIGYGYSRIKQKLNSEREATQSGNHFRVGLISDYSMNKHFAFFLGIHYIDSNFDIETNQAHEDYFGKSTQLQFTLGIKIH